jgi:hypothetical protein
MIKCVCIDAEDRPSKIPQHKWLEKGKEYTLAFSMTVLPQKKLAFQVQEIDLDDVHLYDNNNKIHSFYVDNLLNKYFPDERKPNTIEKN